MFKKSWTFPFFITAGITLLIFIVYPVPGDRLTYSRSLYSIENQLLSAKVSSDGQWCLPLSGNLPKSFESCIVEYEDAYFYLHPGINPVSMVKALFAYVRNGKVQRGASTIPMQVMRMRYKNVRRNMWNKTLESLSAVKYSLTRKKCTVVRDWAQMAPFGGNTIGARSAALRYFGRDLANLSWAEYALLAVMPNSPTAVNLSRNREKLKGKRDFLLYKLAQKDYFPKSDLSVYLSEELPTVLKQIPNEAPFVLDFLSKKYPDQFLYESTISMDLQMEMTDMVEREIRILRQDDIRNAAAVVVNVEDNTVLAYVGNVRVNEDLSRNFVDIIQAPRSYGSLLKPFLYAYALQEGFILPRELVFDIPTAIGDFRPKNFDERFRGAVRVDEVILSSLNVPAVRLLHQVGLPGFYHWLQKIKPQYLDRGVDHYGMSLILGGGETSLWEMSRLYKGLAQNYAGHPFPFKTMKLLKSELEHKGEQVFFSPSVILPVVETMSDVSRPREERFWNSFNQTQKIAWKTGTSYGHRDAWSIGFNGKYMVGIWIGNENGEGRHDLTGIVKAAPLMFQVFKSLPGNSWFNRVPEIQKTKTISICHESGRLAGKWCKSIEKRKVDRESFRWLTCSFHTEVWKNKQGLWSDPVCAPDGFKDTLFTLPPEVEYYYKESHLFYKGLPAMDPNCRANIPSLSIIYPTNGVKIFIPKGQYGQVRSIVAKAHHSVSEAQLFWFLDDRPIPDISNITNKWSRVLNPSPGRHKLTIIDQWGNRTSVDFEVLEGS